MSPPPALRCCGPALPALLSAALLAASAGPCLAKGRPMDPKPAGPVELRGAPIGDTATRVSVPLSAELSVVLDLPEHFWVQCPRHLPTPTSLDGDGVIVQYMNPRGGSVSMLYVGAVPVHPAMDPGEAFAARAARTASDFAVGLAAKYARVDWALTTSPVAVAAATIKVDGKKTPGWRTARYATHPAVAYGGPESVFAGECLFFSVEAAERLVYVALDAKGGGTTLDAATARISVKPTRGVNPSGRRVQLNDLAVAQDPARFPVRLIGFTAAPGFVVTPEVVALTGEWLYAEDRLDEAGRTTARLRIRQRPAEAGRPAAADLEEERALWAEAERGPVETIDLSVRGHVAPLFAHPAPADGASARAHTAIVRLDDQTLFLTWTTLGDAAQVARDHDAFVALLRSMDLAVRW